MSVQQEGEAMEQEKEQRQQRRRRCWQLYKAVLTLIRREWLHVEEETTRVVDSVAHLRHRLWLESRLLLQPTPPWKISQEFLLLPEDVELALQHDLKQHERMMLALQRLLHQLSEIQDAMGRALERVLLQDFEEEETRTRTTIQDKLLEVQAMLAQELYRKQVWMQQLMETYRDDCLLWKPKLDEQETKAAKGWKVALQCSKEWSMKATRFSCVDMSLLQRLFLLLENPKDNSADAKD